MKDFVLELNSFGFGFGFGLGHFKLGNDYITTIKVSASDAEELKKKLDDKVFSRLKLEGSDISESRFETLLNELLDIPAHSFEYYLYSFQLTADDHITLQEIKHHFDMEI